MLSQEIEGTYMLQAAESVLNTPMHERGVAANGEPAIVMPTAIIAAHRLSGKCSMQASRTGEGYYVCLLVGKTFATG